MQPPQLHANVETLLRAQGDEKSFLERTPSGTVERVHQRFVERGLEAALGRKPQDRPGRERKLDGRAAWTLQLLVSDRS